MAQPRKVRIHYHRPPERYDLYVQHLLLDRADVKVTFARGMAFDPPLRIASRVALEDGSDAVWFTFPGVWHDIGRFHRADGTFTGIYANVITPPTFHPGGIWRTTDLFLDVWLDADHGPPRLLDRDQLAEAERRGWLEPELASRARKEAERIVAAARDGAWPPRVVEEWTRTRALAEVERDEQSDGSGV